MSWWIYLNNPETGATYDVEAHTEGGTYAVNGTPNTEVNVTYNYGCMFAFRDLHGKTARETLPVMAGFLEAWGHLKPYKADYWAPTPGNVAQAVRLLRDWAVAFPDGVWDVS